MLMIVLYLFSHKDPEFISAKLGKVLEGYSEWLVDKKVSLHLGKTEYILFGPKRKLNKDSQFSVSLMAMTSKDLKSEVFRSGH